MLQLQSLKDLQTKWYKILKDETDFEDIEDHTVGGFEVMSDGTQVQAIDGGRPLKRWSGIGGEIIFSSHQEPLVEIQSNFPEPIRLQEQNLINNHDFDHICEIVCQHGNHTLNAKKVKRIWESFLLGETLRVIADDMGINHVLVFRTVKALKEWAHFLDNNDE